MGRGFRRAGPGFRCRLDADEAFVVRRLAGELQMLLAEAVDPGVGAGGGSGGGGRAGRGAAQAEPAPEPEGVRAGPAGAPDGAPDGAPGRDEQERDDLERMVHWRADTPPRPTDPVLARLFPDAYADAEQAGEFRRFTQNELATGKQARLALLCDTVSERGGDIVLDAAGAEAWLGALNDLRLAVGARIGITDESYLDEGPAAGGDDSSQAMLAIYDFLTYLQGTLVEALAGW